MKTDLELQKDILDEISWEPSLSAQAIQVTVHNRMVTLSGSVDNLPAKRAAEDAALRVVGVKSVVNDIDVRLSTDSRRSDPDITLAASNTLEWNVISPKNLKAVVEDGWITLIGKVHWQFQKKAAEEAVKQLQGVKGVTNHITIKPLVTSLAVNGKIEAALRRQATLDSRKIHVDVENGKVTLDGTVGSWVERQEAEKVAWSAPGVIQVENNLVIQNRKS
jgi:osmotically-inducible protein OsmY